jgi:hypothetical protein
MIRGVRHRQTRQIRAITASYWVAYASDRSCRGLQISLQVPFLNGRAMLVSLIESI